MAVKLADVIFALSIVGLARNTLALLVNRNASKCHSYTIIEKSYVQVVKLAGVILALSIEVLVGVILTKPLKTTSKEKTAQLGSHGFEVARKLHCFAGLTHLGVLGSILKAERCRY